MIMLSRMKLGCGREGVSRDPVGTGPDSGMVREIYAAIFEDSLGDEQGSLPGMKMGPGGQRTINNLRLFSRQASGWLHGAKPDRSRKSELIGAQRHQRIDACGSARREVAG
jgi:hypothetical protein